MTHDIEVRTWADFQQQMERLQIRTTSAAPSDGHASELLFRGQSNAEWHLQTTLERWAKPEVDLQSYYANICAVQSEIESQTGRKWEIPKFAEYQTRWLSEDGYDYLTPGQLYEYLVYLRHHGFPSPLLDWTASPYIAAYFAFKSSDPADPMGNVAIYAYREHARGVKFGIRYAPRICVLGPFVRSHQRHFLQQSRYTVCLEGCGVDRRYVPHERAFDIGHTDQDQEWKFVLPRSLRKEVLRYLQQHNITAFSLFGSEEMLMESLATREFVLQRK